MTTNAQAHKTRVGEGNVTRPSHYSVQYTGQVSRSMFCEETGNSGQTGQ